MKIPKVGVRKLSEPAPVRRYPLQRRQFMRITDSGNGPQQNGVYPAENGRIGRNGQPKGAHGDAREPWAVPQDSESEPQILPDIPHIGNKEGAILRPTGKWLIQCG